MALFFTPNGRTGNRLITVVKGDKGDQGDAATIEVGTVTSVPNGSPATVTNVGTSSEAVFDFEIPEGDQGEPGTAATITVGTVTTVASSEPATVTNVGTANAAIFDFEIPQGPSGEMGGPGVSVDGEIALFNGTSGTELKRATTTGLLKASSGVLAQAVSGTDYAPATSGTSILKGNGSGGFSNAAAGTDYLAPAAIGSTVQAYDANTAKLNAAQTWTKVQTFAKVIKLMGVNENAQTSGTGLSGTLNFDQNTYAIYWSTANATGNWTLNVRGDSSTTLNSSMSTGDVVTVVVVSTQGSTAYYQSAMQIDGASVTPKWIGGAPSAGTASSTELYQFWIRKTGDAAFSVLGMKLAFT